MIRFALSLAAAILISSGGFAAFGSTLGAGPQPPPLIAHVYAHPHERLRVIAHVVARSHVRAIRPIFAAELTY